MSAAWDRLHAQRSAPKPKPEIDGPWDMSGPEAGDGDDTVLVMLDGVERITIHAGTLAKRKSIARRIARLLNEAEATLD